MSSPFQIPVADLMRRPGASRAVTVSESLAGLGDETVSVPGDQPVAVDIALERIPEGIVVRGTVRAPWQAVCCRCLEPVGDEVSVHVDELFEPDPLPGETYKLDAESLDLEPMVRDSLVLELPLAPVCREDCAGLCPSCGVNRNESTCDCTSDDSDPRWAALRSLEL